MKKLFSFVLVLSLMTALLFGCSPTSNTFSGEWNFAELTKVEIAPDVDASTIEALKEQYGAEDEASLEAAVLADLIADGTFDECYLNFTKTNAYTYDPIFEREATWVFYQTGENEGFISFYAELDAADGNPDPMNNPTLVYNSQDGTISMTYKHIAYVVTLKLSK